MKTKQKVCNIIIISVFLLCIYVVSAWCIIKKDGFFSENENRYLSKMPEFSAKTLFDGSFGTKYETYLSDQFIFRDKFITLKTTIEKSMLKSDASDVFFGKDNYLIGRYDDASFNDVTVNRNVDALTKFLTTYSEKMGGEHVKALFAPTSAMVLTDKLPYLAAPYDENILIERLKKATPYGTIIDATDNLKKHKEEYIYFKTDHHWTSLGAYYGYEAWANATNNKITPLKEYEKTRVTSDFLGTTYSKICFANSSDYIDTYDNKSIRLKVLYDGFLTGDYDKSKVFDSLYVTSHLNEKDKYQIFLDGNHPVVDIETSNNNGKKLLLIKDSYSHCFMQYIISNYQYITMIDTRYFNKPISELKPEQNYTDILVLRNTVKFMQDDSVFKLSLGL